MVDKKPGRNQHILPNTIISVRIQTRASRNVIKEIRADGKIKIGLTAPPVDGMANSELIRFLGKVLDTAPSNLKIVSGLTNREKLVSISNLDPQTISQRINKFISEK